MQLREADFTRLPFLTSVRDKTGALGVLACIAFEKRSNGLIFFQLLRKLRRFFALCAHGKRGRPALQYLFSYIELTFFYFGTITKREIWLFTDILLSRFDIKFSH